MPTIHRARHAAGYTLLEVLVVVTLLGLLGAVALPNDAAVDPERMAVASGRVRYALGLARAEAVRTAQPHGVAIDRTRTAIRVFRADLAASPADLSATLRDPTSQQLADWSTATRGLPPGSALNLKAEDGFDFVGHGVEQVVLFDRHGQPFWSEGGGASPFRLSRGVVAISLGVGREEIGVDPVHGVAGTVP